MLLQNQSFCGPALSTDAGNALFKLAGQLLQSRGSGCELNPPFIAFSGKDWDPPTLSTAVP